MDDYLSTLVKCPVFRGLSENQIDKELHNIIFQIKDYKLQESVVLSDDPCNQLMIVLAGKVKGEMTDYSGKVIRIEELDAGKPLAPAFIFGKNNQYPVDIIALEATKLISIPKASLLSLFHNNEIILNNYLSLISNRAQFLTSRIRFLSFQSIKGKIAQYLLKQTKDQKSDYIEIKASHNELAEIFGVTRPSLTRAIRELDNDKIIKAEGKKIRIINHNELKLLVR